MRLHAATVARFVVVAILEITSAHGDPGTDHADLHARYAAARLRLAEARLAKAEQLNGKTPGLLAETDMRRLRSRVTVLRDLIGVAHDQPHGHAAAVQKAVAAAARRIAEEDLAAAKAARQRQPSAVSSADLEQLELKAEIAALRRTRGSLSRRSTSSRCRSTSWPTWSTTASIGSMPHQPSTGLDRRITAAQCPCRERP